ncbi:YlbG family protein [Allobacillus sp. GCM10007491]|nr:MULTISPECIES: YlbG family protein [Allobacillus]
MFTKRQGLIIWFRHMKNLRKLKRLGHLIYASKKKKYALIYVDQDELEDVKQQAENYNFVKRVDISFRPEVEMEFEHRQKPIKRQGELESFPRTS